MTPSEYPEHVTKELCRERSGGIKSDIREIKQDIQKINGKLWGILLMIIAQLFGVLTIFIKGCAT